MIKAVIFDIDNTLYSYDENHIYGMEALAVYCRDSFGITTDEMQACYRKAGRIMTDRIGTDTAAIHSRMLRMQCMLELLEQPLFPLVFCSNVGLQILRSEDRPCVRVPHPIAVNQQAVYEIHNGQDDKQLPEARRKAACTVYPIDTDQHIADIAGDADGFEK